MLSRLFSLRSRVVDVWLMIRYLVSFAEFLIFFLCKAILRSISCLLFLPVVNKFYVSSGTSESIRDLKAELSDMKVWIASSLHRGEEEGTNYLLFFFLMYLTKLMIKVVCTVILGVHNLLLQSHPDSVVIIVPRHPHHGHQIAQVCSKTNFYLFWLLAWLRL